MCVCVLVRWCLRREMPQGLDVHLARAEDVGNLPHMHASKCARVPARKATEAHGIKHTRARTRTQTRYTDHFRRVCLLLLMLLPKRLLARTAPVYRYDRKRSMRNDNTGPPSISAEHFLVAVAKKFNLYF